MSTGPLISVELDADTAPAALRLLRAGSAADAPRGRTYALVDLGAEPPGWVAVAVVADVGSPEPLLTDVLVADRARGHGHERELLDAVVDRLRACGARRRRITDGVALDL